jgi:hypothetical protein
MISRSCKIVTNASDHRELRARGSLPVRPTAPAAGVDLVFVNGTMAWRDGAPVPGARPGRLVS